MNVMIEKPATVATYVRTVPQRVVSRGIVLTDSGLNNSIRVVAGPGAGKSRWAGRIPIWQRLIRGKPAICIDPTGGIVANLFDKLCRQPEPVQALLWPRIRYVDTAASDYIVPMPLYQRQTEDETLITTANRFLEVIRRIDPHLISASVEGWNALYEVGTAAGMMATALGLQITEVADMMRNPHRWKALFKRAHNQYPDELQEAYAYFQELMSINKPALRKRRTSSFLIKLIPFLADPTMKAMFASERSGLDLDAEMANGHLVLYDFQGEHDPVRRRMKLLWTFLEHVAFAKQRGDAGRQNPVLYVIDEITQLLGQDPLAHSLMADDFNELTTVVARNFGLPLCLMHQNLVRKEEPVWMSVEKGSRPNVYHVPEIIDYTTTEYGLEEQVHLVAKQFRTLGRFHFLVRTAAGEGDLSQELVPMTIDKLDVGQYPSSEMIAEVRRRLRKRDGVPIATLLAQIATRGETQLTLKPHPGKKRKPKTEDDTIEKDTPSHGPATTDNLPEPEAGATPAAKEEPSGDETDWKDTLWGKRKETATAPDEAGR